MTELRFDHLRSTHPRQGKPRGIVLHWTGGIRDAAGFYRTLRGRKGKHTPDGLSIHHFIDRDGGDWQMAAYDLVCLHAGDVNEWTIGIEIQNPALPGKMANLERKRFSCNRPDVVERLRGRELRYLDFTPAQYEAVALRVEQLCDLFDIPRRVPVDVAGGLLRRQMKPYELMGYCGILGHYHCHENKNDPGPRLLECFRRRWA